MTTKVIQNVRVDEQLRTAFRNTAENLGTTPSALINIFMKKVVVTGGVPFNLQTNDRTSLESSEEYEKNSKILSDLVKKANPNPKYYDGSTPEKRAELIEMLRKEDERDK